MDLQGVFVSSSGSLDVKGDGCSGTMLQCSSTGRVQGEVLCQVLCLCSFGCSVGSVMSSLVFQLHGLG